MAQGFGGRSNLAMEGTIGGPIVSLKTSEREMFEFCSSGVALDLESSAALDRSTSTDLDVRGPIAREWILFAAVQVLLHSSIPILSSCISASLLIFLDLHSRGKWVHDCQTDRRKRRVLDLLLDRVHMPCVVRLGYMNE